MAKFCWILRQHFRRYNKSSVRQTSGNGNVCWSLPCRRNCVWSNRDGLIFYPLRLVEPCCLKRGKRLHENRSVRIFSLQILSRGISFAPQKELPKSQGSLGNVGSRVFVFTDVQAHNYSTSSGDDEGNCVYNWKGINASYVCIYSLGRDLNRPQGPYWGEKK